MLYLYIARSAYDIIILYSMEKTLKNMESRHSLKQRWKPGDEGFDSAVKLIGKERRSDALRALHALSIERHFFLTLKKKYAGNFVFFFVFTSRTFYLLLYIQATAHAYGTYQSTHMLNSCLL